MEIETCMTIGAAVQLSTADFTTEHQHHWSVPHLVMISHLVKSTAIGTVTLGAKSGHG